jgi:adenine-specific DNA methylase
MAPYRKKLIEVAPRSRRSTRSRRARITSTRGNPSAVHKWWAQRPLAACRAVLFASLVDDPSSRPEQFPTEEAQERERQRLFQVLEELVRWESSNDEATLQAARAEIMRSTAGRPPPVLDPFCGAGSIPLEAQRLGLEAADGGLPQPGLRRANATGSLVLDLARPARVSGASATGGIAAHLSQTSVKRTGLSSIGS